jgi:hypothetical protein
MTRTLAILAAAVAASATLAACSGSHDAVRQQREARAQQTERLRSTVRTWSARLDDGDNEGVARMFAIPVTIRQGPYVYRLLSPAQVELWFASLPCAGKVVSIDVRGHFATGVFRLADRSDSMPCSGPGTLAAARFEIRGGKIVSWTQVAVPKRRPPGTTGA